MGMSAIDLPVKTIEQLLAIPDDGKRHELLAGEHCVTPAPSYVHQLVVQKLALILGSYLNEENEFVLLHSPADVRLGANTVVQPDIFVLRIDPTNPPTGWIEIGVPILAIEVLSPATAAKDRGKKRQIYQHAGIEQYWIVDPDSRLVERWRPDDKRPEILAEELRWTPDETTEELSVDLKKIFGSIAGAAG